MEVNRAKDLNETHEDQDWRKISISRIMFFALDN